MGWNTALCACPLRIPYHSVDIRESINLDQTDRLIKEVKGLNPSSMLQTYMVNGVALIFSNLILSVL